MPNYSYDLLRVEIADGVARATIDHPPINLLDLRLMGELDRLETELRADDAVRVVIFDSANPDFFLAHYDIADLISRCGPPPAPAVTLKRFHAMLEPPSGTGGSTGPCRQTNCARSSLALVSGSPPSLRPRSRGPSSRSMRHCRRCITASWRRHSFSAHRWRILRANSGCAPIWRQAVRARKSSCALRKPSMQRYRDCDERE